MGYIEAIKRPFGDMTKLVIGVVISLIPIVNFIGIGYFLQCAKLTFKKDEKLPEWTDWANLFITGLVAAIICLIWAIPTMLVAWITIGSVLSSASGAMLTGGMTAFASAIMASIGTLMVGLAVTLVVGIIFGLLGCAAVLRYAEKGKFAAAFEFGAIKDVAFKGGFVAALIVGVVYMMVVSVILAFIPLIGGAIATFIAGVAMWTMLAEAYKG
jgi:hypothetical protein